MKIHKIQILTLLLTLVISCKNNESSKEIIEHKDTTVTQIKKFPEVRNLSEFKQTEFLPTLEHQISNDKNSVYCSTLLFAWQSITEQLNSNLTISNNCKDLILLNKSKSHIGVLEKNEYNIQTQIIQDTIKVKAEFSKTLPFEHKLDNFDKELIFKGNEVSSFGISQFSSDEQKNIIKITYYKNDDNFIIKLLPDNKEHQIILFKSSDNYSTIAEMIEEIDKLTYIGKSEMISDRFKWKYTFNKGDWVIIPKINFNLETNFESIVGCSFKTKLKEYKIIKAWQRSALILDESGSSIESEAEMVAAASASPFREEIIKPKKMKFDKPFLLLLKRSDSRNPYFGLWTTNSELMIK